MAKLTNDISHKEASRTVAAEQAVVPEIIVDHWSEWKVSIKGCIVIYHWKSWRNTEQQHNNCARSVRDSRIYKSVNLKKLQTKNWQNIFDLRKQKVLWKMLLNNLHFAPFVMNIIIESIRTDRPATEGLKAAKIHNNIAIKAS